MAESVPALGVGARVRVERDETRWPSRGTWPRYQGRIGTVVEVNTTEYGVVFGAVSRHSKNGSLRAADGSPATWFLRHELATLAQPLSASQNHGQEDAA